MRPPLSHGAPRSPARTALAVAAMVALLAIAALATRGGGGGSTAPPGTATAVAAGHHVFIVAALVLTPVLAVVGAALFMYAQIYRRRQLDPELRRRMRAARIRAAIAAAGLLAVLAYAVRTGRNPFAFLQHALGAAGRGHTGAPNAHRPPPPHASVTSTDWQAAVLVWAILAAAAVFLVMRSRARRRELAPLVLATDGDEAAEPDIDALRRERNPRRAVIAAYAAMERHMAREGLPRGVHEAPMEYLGRVTLHGHEQVACVHRLTALFQRAKFSHRPVDEDMRRGAIAAVEELARGAGEPA